MGCLQFGEFTLDRHARELRRQEVVLPITGKAFDLLSYMVSNAGRPLTKSELLDAIWPQTSVEESNLSQNVFLLRKVLGSDGPIKTLPGRGYQFAGQVTEIQSNSASNFASNAATPPAAAPTRSISMETTRTRLIREDVVEDYIFPSGRSVVATIVALVLLLFSGLLLHRHLIRKAESRPSSSPASALSAPANTQTRRAVAILGFRNASSRSEDAWLSTAVTEMLASNISAGDRLRVISSEEVAHAQSDLGLKVGAVDLDRVRGPLRQATGADLLVHGSYVVVSHGTTPALRLMVQIEDASSGRQVASFSETGEVVGLFTLVDQAGLELRKDLSDRGSAQDDEEAFAGMSQSTDALRFYAEGVDQERHFDSHGARSLFERAVEADPKFAMAHLGLADVWADLGFMPRASQEASEAYKLSNNLPKVQRLAIEAEYRQLSSDDERAIADYKALSTCYPDDATWSLKLAAIQLQNAQQKEAVDTLERLRKLPLTPSETVELEGLEARSYAYLDDTNANDKARTLLDDALSIANKQSGLFVHGRAFRYKCSVLSHIGPVPEGMAACEQAKTTYQAIGNLLAVAAATNNIGVLSQQMGDWTRAEAAYAEARRQYHQIGSFELEIDEIQNLAHLALSHGELQKAIQGSRQLARVTGTSDDDHNAYTGHLYSAIALELSGRLHEAQVEAMAAQLAAEKEKASDNKVYHQARTRDLQGWIAFRAGNLGDAERLINEAIIMIKPSRDAAGEANFADDLASVTLEQGHAGNEVVDGVRHAVEVLAKLQDESDEYIEAEVLLARMDMQTGAAAEASKAIAQARTSDSKGDSMHTHLTFLLGEANFELALGHFTEAKKILQEEVSIAEPRGYAYFGIDGEIGLARLDEKTFPSSQNAARVQSLGRQAEQAGFKALARRALAPQT